MDKITLPEASQLTSPNPVTLVCTEKEDGSTNLATVSWWTYLSFNPSMIAYAMSKTSFSGERVRETEEVIVTVPGSDISDAVMMCGMSTGRNTDKIAETGLEMKSIDGSGIQIPAHTKVAIHCRLKEFVEVGDHYLYICNVEDVFGDESEDALFAWNGYAEVSAAAKK